MIEDDGSSRFKVTPKSASRMKPEARQPNRPSAGYNPAENDVIVQPGEARGGAGGELTTPLKTPEVPDPKSGATTPAGPTAVGDRYPNPDGTAGQAPSVELHGQSSVSNHTPPARTHSPDGPSVTSQELAAGPRTHTGDPTAGAPLQLEFNGLARAEIDSFCIAEAELKPTPTALNLSQAGASYSATATAVGRAGEELVFRYLSDLAAAEGLSRALLGDGAGAVVEEDGASWAVE